MHRLALATRCSSSSRSLGSAACSSTMRLARLAHSRPTARAMHTSTAPSSAGPTSASAASASAPSSASSSGSGAPVGVSSGFAAMLQGVLAGDRLSLSRAITLVESGHPDHARDAAELMRRIAEVKRQEQPERQRRAKEAHQLLDAMTPEQRASALPEKPRSLRIGVSGPPGVGKSTFIECFGQYLLSLGHRLAVLSIDPSSHVSGGSILGDKTRMLELSRNENAYVRPSPSRCVLGGVGAHTFDAILLCEAAGFDLVFVETVGVGQSEVSVADMVDMLILLVQPGGGDELQGMKKGIVELIDLIVVNKADGPLLTNARHTKMEYMHALQLNTRRKKETDWKPLVRLCSSVSESSAAGQSDYSHPHTTDRPTNQKEQIAEIWKNIGEFDEWAKGPLGDFHLRRSRQSKSLLHQSMQDDLAARLTRALDALPAYRALQERWEREEKRARDKSVPQAEQQHEPELVPRVEAQRIVDEWLKLQATKQ